MVTQEVQQILKSGVKTHFSDLYNVVDFCMLEAYIGALSLFHMIMLKVRSQYVGPTSVHSVCQGRGQITIYERLKVNRA